MNKIVLVALNSSYSHTNPALRYIRQKLTADSRLEVVFLEKTINEPWLELFQSLITEKADIYAFSCYIWNRILVEQLSLNLKRIYPTCKILWGGPDASSQAALLLQRNPYLDQIVLMEGDSATVDWIHNYFFDPRANLNECKIIPETEEINWQFPYTDQELRDLNERILYYESSRGCVFNCTYCLSANTFQTRFKPLEEVFAELEHIMQFNPRQLKFIDRTFNSDQARAYAIWKFLIEKTKELKTRTNFHFEITVELMTDQQIELLRQAPVGLFQFEIGAQTTNPEILKIIRRPYHPAAFKKKVKQLRQAENIHIHLDLIAGLPGETLASQIQSANELLDLNPEMLQMGFLKVLPNVPIRKECDARRMIYQNFPPYEVLASDAMSADDLMFWRAIEKIVDTYYNSGQYFYFIQYLLALIKKPIQLFIILQKYIKERYGDNKISQQNRFQVLADFSKTFSRLLLDPEQTEIELTDLGFYYRQKIDLFHKILIDLLKVEYFRQGLKGFPDWFKSLQGQNDLQAREIIHDMQMALLGKNIQQRLRYEKFSFSLADLPGFQEDGVHFSGAGNVQPDRDRLIHYLSQIDEKTEYICGLQIGHGKISLLTEQKL